MLVVELVERAIVDVLGVEPDEVLPHACLAQDLGASSADIATLMQRLQAALSVPGLTPLCPRHAGLSGGAFTVEELVDLVESLARNGRATTSAKAPTVLVEIGSAA